MQTSGEQQLVGLEYLGAVTALLRRVRKAHPTQGLFEAADLNFWWRVPRPTDDMPQLFWFDEAGNPEAAVIVTEWGEGVSGVYTEPTINPMVMPDASADWVAHVVERGLAHAGACGVGSVELEIDRNDGVLREVISRHGFIVTEETVVEAWLLATDRPVVSSLVEGYRLCSRVDTMPRPHHMAERSGPAVEVRLRENPLYRPDLDLVVLDRGGNDAAFGMFWFDPETATGLVEPMRTYDDHQQRGLARHILTAGVDLLANAGAERIKICFDPTNQAASHLYSDVGFTPVKQTDLFAGQATHLAG